MADDEKDKRQAQLEGAQFEFDRKLPSVSDAALDTWVRVYEWRLERLRHEISRRKFAVGKGPRKSTTDAAQPHPKHRVHKPGED